MLIFLIVDTLPRQVYLNLLLYLPAMYFSRIAGTFENAEVSKQNYMRFIIGTWKYGYDHYDIEEVWISAKLNQNVADFRYGE